MPFRKSLGMMGEWIQRGDSMCNPFETEKGVLTMIRGCGRYLAWSSSGFAEALGAGRKTRAKALKLLVSRKENEARQPSFPGLWQGFRL